MEMESYRLEEALVAALVRWEGRMLGVRTEQDEQTPWEHRSRISARLCKLSLYLG